MNKVFCEALKMAAYAYTNYGPESDHYDKIMFKQFSNILSRATEYGLVKWIGRFPVIMVEKMTGEKE